MKCINNETYTEQSLVSIDAPRFSFDYIKRRLPRNVKRLSRNRHVSRREDGCRYGRIYGVTRSAKALTRHRFSNAAVHRRPTVKRELSPKPPSPLSTDLSITFGTLRLVVLKNGCATHATMQIYGVRSILIKSTLIYEPLSVTNTMSFCFVFLSCIVYIFPLLLLLLLLLRRRNYGAL